jgi:RNA polymerase sigma-70 factor (ECF subfamily)
LIDRARAGDAGAFGELVRRYQPLASHVARLVAPRADVEDSVQEAFLKAYRSLPRFRTGAPFRPWLCRIVANEAKNRARSARRREGLALKMVDDRAEETPSPDTTVLARDEARVLIDAMNRLRGDDRLVIAYRWLLDLSESEMAVALGIKPGTVKSRLSRAMTRLRTELLQDAEGDGAA